MSVAVFEVTCRAFKRSVTNSGLVIYQTGNVFWLALWAFDPFYELRELLFCVDLLPAEAGELAALTMSLEHQVAVHTADLASARDNMTRVEESVTVAQRQLADA